MRASSRHYELDWLRIFVIWGAMAYHVIRGIQLYVPSVSTNGILSSISALLNLWGMPLLFCVAGASAWFALMGRTELQFLADRFKRLMAPFLMGILVVIPPEEYIGNHLNPTYHQSFPSFFLAKLGQYGQLFHGNAFDNFIALWGHLWFIPDLLLFSLVALPLFAWMKTRSGIWTRQRFATWCERPGVLLGVGLFFTACEVVRETLLPPSVADYLRPVLFFFLSFIAGFLLYSDERIKQAILREGPFAFAIGVLLFILFQWVHLAPGVSPSLRVLYSGLFIGYGIWVWIIAILNIGMRFLTTANAGLFYWKDASFSFYVLHILILAIIGFFVIQWPIPVPLQFLILLGASGAGLLVIYDQGIRPHNVLRVLFGIRPLTVQERQQDESYLRGKLKVLGTLRKHAVSEIPPRLT